MGTPAGVDGARRHTWKRGRLIAIAVVAILVGSTATALAQQEDPRARESYRAQLAGGNEVPANQSASLGRAGVRLAVNADFATFELQLLNELANATQAHIHMAAPGSNGPIVVWFYPSGPPAAPPQTFNRVSLASGTFGPANLVGPLAGNWDGFVNALHAGNLYVNVHTSAFPPGEIRGQLAPASEVPRGPDD